MDQDHGIYGAGQTDRHLRSQETRWSAQDAALYVTPNDEFAFAEGIATLMDHPDLRAQMGEFGRRRIETDLKWDIVGQNLVRAYAALLGNRSSVPPR